MEPWLNAPDLITTSPARVTQDAARAFARAAPFDTLDLIASCPTGPLLAQSFARPRVITIGPHPHDTILWERAASLVVLSAADDGDGWLLHLDAPMEVTLSGPSHRRWLALTRPERFRLSAAAPLCEATISLGALTLQLRLTPPISPPPRPPLWERQTARFALASALIHAGMMAVLLSLPPAPALELMASADDLLLMTRVMHLPPASAPPPAPLAQTPLRDAALGDGEEAGLSAQRAGEAGATGDAEAAPVAPARLSATRQGQRAARPISPAPAPTRAAPDTARALERARALGGALSGDLSDALGQLRDEAPGLSAGQLGLGVSSTGRGGAGRDERAVGIAAIGDSANALRLGGRGHAMDWRALTRDDAPQLSITRAKRDAADCLAPEIVRRVVRARQAQLRACYENALTRAPGLTGALMLSLTILPDGAIGAVKVDRDTLRDASTRACVVDHLRTLRFPAYEGCSSVVARYPLRFHHAPEPDP